MLYPPSIVLVALVAVVLNAFGGAPGQLVVSAPFVLAVVFIAVVWGRGPATVAALASVIVYNYLFIPPVTSFSVPTTEEGLLLVSLLAVALVLGTWRDRVRRAEQEVRNLAASERLQKTLLDTISHDLKTPLTAIMGSLNIFLSEGQGLTARDRRELVSVAYDRSKELDRLVTGVLEMTRLEAGAIRLRREPTQLTGVIETAMARLPETFAEGRCRVEISPKLPLVSVDPVLLSHALANLLENALKFSSPDAPIDVEARAVNGHVLIGVADRGVGVPAEELDRIFEKFYRRKQSDAIEAASTGIGLGLAVAKGVVEAHGGRIWAEQRRGGGIVVRVRLPVAGR
jgi:two-component system sensor histidine kinase KdpD